MSNGFLPGTIDNTYRGRKPALWIFVVVMVMKIMMSLGSMLNGRAALSTADGIPLDTYPAGAAQTIVALFALYALGTLVLCLLCVLAVSRYRSLVPFMFTVLLVEHLSRKAILYFIPMVRVGSPPGFAINLTLLVLIVIGLALSLSRRETGMTNFPGVMQ